MTDNTNEPSNGSAAPSPARTAVNPRPRTRPGVNPPPRTPLQVNPRPRTRPGVAPGAKPTGSGAAQTPRRTDDAHEAGAARVKGSKREKRQPRGDYPVGYARPPVDGQFKANNPGGPGRPKGSRSQDSILRKELETRQTIRIAGRGVKLSQRELAVKILIRKAFEKSDTKLLLQIIQYGQQLFPEVNQTDPAVSVAGNSARDQQVLRDLFDGLSLGEPDPDNPDPFAGIGAPLADLTADYDADGHGEMNTDRSSDGSPHEEMYDDDE